MKKNFLLAAAFFVVVNLAACASDPPTRYYTLVAGPDMVTSGAVNGNSSSIGVGPIQLSGALENIGVVTSNGQHQLVCLLYTSPSPRDS